MAQTKRLEVFVRNWLGLLIAGVIMVLSAAFGGVYFYANNHIDATLVFTTQFVTLRVPDGLVQTGTAGDDPGYVYHVIVQVGNKTPDSANVTVSDLEIKIGTYTFDIMRSGVWTKTVTQASGDSTGYENFEGDFTVDSATFAALVLSGPLNANISGHVDSSARYMWLSGHKSREFDIVLLDLKL